jgi:hypothetical protein
MKQGVIMCSFGAPGTVPAQDENELNFFCFGGVG